MVAFDYPPSRGSSGVQRTLRFSSYLLDYGWRAIVLTVNPRAYPSTSKDLIGDIPNEVVVKRCFTLDAARHLSVKRKYLKIFALPDRWSNWKISAIPNGLYLIKKYKPDFIWSTYPIASAHQIAAVLQKNSDIPWIADFRDPMIQPSHPKDIRTRSIYKKIEKNTVENASKLIFTTPGALKIYKEKYPLEHKDKFSCITNGYDENCFAVAEKSVNVNYKSNNKNTFIHSGVLYPQGRNPLKLFQAISELKKEGGISEDTIEIILRATGHDKFYLKTLSDLNINGIIKLKPPIAYNAAVAEMIQADCLLLIQGAEFNHQIPAKVYEYLRAKKPIIALAEEFSDTAQLLKESGCAFTASLDDKSAIKKILLEYLNSDRATKMKNVSEGFIEKYSRKSKAKELAEILDNL